MLKRCPKLRTKDQCRINFTVAHALVRAASSLSSTLLRSVAAGVGRGIRWDRRSFFVVCRAVADWPGHDRPRKTMVCPTTVVWGVVLLALAATVGCRSDMQDQPKYTPLRPSTFFEDGRSQRPLIEGTIPRGHLDDDAAFYTGKGPDGKTFLETFPFPVTRQVIERGQNRFTIYCTPCHGQLGFGDGKIVRRGYKHPPSYHSDRLRKVQAGYIFDVITNGFGAMPDYAAQVAPADRWAIVSYIRTLQLSENGTLNDVPPDARGQLSQGGAQ